jgi:hypothetical protein
MLHSVFWKKFTDVADVLVASVIRALIALIGKLLPDYKAHHPRRQSSS